MKQIYLVVLSTLISLSLFSQKESKISLELNYGINGNFFVRSYNETEGPGNKTYFLKKNFIGPVGGIELKYRLNKKSRLGIAYAKATNKKEIQYTGSINGVSIGIKDFKISHINKFFQLYYERDFNKKTPSFKYHIGLLYLLMNQQEIEISNFANAISIEERNFKRNKLEEGGVFAGLHYSKKIDTRFEAGIKARVYYLISTSSLEAITLTPTLTYHFK